MTVVVFNSTTFKARYPEFAAVPDALLTAYFAEAGLYLSNKDNSRVQDVTRRELLLNMITAHIATLGGALSADGQPRPVGRMSSASEGSVSVAFDATYPPGSAQWFNQTQYGAAFWQATINLRSFRYVPRPTVY